eukprot:TRINITY_DN7545_c0_g1_i1.p1 TRINITY_DN7545_c0_g1~~TRINITY_DN7545_c0_g1_i1.p1  ORF type:complete len:404 (-),score=100.06 TRINITY_DN7545_c0_g1_i1:13-1200(-)
MTKIALSLLFLLYLSSLFSFASSSRFSSSLNTKKALKDDFQKGMTFADGRWCPTVRFDSPSAILSLEDLAETGANWIAVIVTWFQHNINTTDIYPLPVKTATDDELDFIIDLAHSKGLKVMLKPHIDLANETNPELWRGDIGWHYTADQWQMWFPNYKNFILHYAALATKLKVEQLAVGTELIVSDLHDPEWRSVVSEIRKVFPGNLTYACNFWGDNVFGSTYSPLNVTWWDVVDIIGVDAYFPLSGNTTQPTYEQLLGGWSDHVFLLETLVKTYNKPLIFTEIGYTSQTGCNRQPNKWKIDGQLNFTIQEACYQALFEAVAKPHSDWFHGAFWWSWWTDPLAGTEGDYQNLYTPQNKPVLKVLKHYYGGQAKTQMSNRTHVPDLKPQHCGVPNG